MANYVPDRLFADTFICDRPNNFHDSIFISEKYSAVGSPLYCINRAGNTYAIPQLFHVKRKANFKCCHIFCITNGKGRLYVDGLEYALQKDMIIVLSNVSPHEYHSDPHAPLGVTWLEFYGSDSNQVVGQIINQQGHVFSGDLFLTVVKKITALIKLASSCSAAACSRHIYDILMDLFDASQNAYLKDADVELFAKFLPLSQYIDAHLGDKLSMDTLASLVGYSSPHFTKLFKQVFETSPHEFILQRKITAAKCLLSCSAMPIAVIATKLGFCDTSHFIKRFKQYELMAPSDYRHTCPK